MPTPTDKPLFIPLKTKYYQQFIDGTKDTEYRKYGPGWNEKTCKVGRKVVISKGYGKAHRRTGVITNFVVQNMDSQDWIDCYGEPGKAACITIKLDDASECEKMIAVQSKSRIIGEFCEWLKVRGYAIVDHNNIQHTHSGNIINGTVKFMGDTEAVIAEYFDIDLEALEREKLDILKLIRQGNKELAS